MKKNIIQNIKSIILTLVLVGGVSYVSAVSTWKEPTAIPPGNNTDTPITQGGRDGTDRNKWYSQIKTGILTLDHLVAGDLTVTNEGVVAGIPSGSMLVADGDDTGKVKWGAVGTSGGGDFFVTGSGFFDSGPSSEVNLGSDWDLVILNGQFSGGTSTSVLGGFVSREGNIVKANLLGQNISSSLSSTLSADYQCADASAGGSKRYWLCFKLSGGNLMLKKGSDFPADSQRIVYVKLKSGGSGTGGGGGGVTRIIAGNNITISPSTGVGDVTINSSGGGSSGSNFAKGSVRGGGVISTNPYGGLPWRGCSLWGEVSCTDSQNTISRDPHINCPENSVERRSSSIDGEGGTSYYFLCIQN